MYGLPGLEGRPMKVRLAHVLRMCIMCANTYQRYTWCHRPWECLSNYIKTNTIAIEVRTKFTSCCTPIATLNRLP